MGKRHFVATGHIHPERSARPTKRHVNELLRAGYNDFGIRRWWKRPRKQLDGKSPAEVWGMDRERVLRLAEALEV